MRHEILLSADGRHHRQVGDGAEDEARVDLRWDDGLGEAVVGPGPQQHRRTGHDAVVAAIFVGQRVAARQRRQGTLFARWRPQQVRHRSRDRQAGRRLLGAAGRRSEGFGRRLVAGRSCHGRRRRFRPHHLHVHRRHSHRGVLTVMNKQIYEKKACVYA